MVIFREGRREKYAGVAAGKYMRYTTFADKRPLKVT
jgi:hypothetical protein